MSKLAAIASIGKKIIGNPNLRKLNSNHIHLVAGAIGGYMGARGALRGSSEHWRSEAPEVRRNYRKAYGSDAFKIYRNKRVISRTITTARAYYEGSKLIGGLAHRDTAAATQPQGEFIGPHDTFARRTLHYIRKNAPGFAKEQIKGLAIDAAVEHGASNIYGGAMQYVHHRRQRLQKGIAKIQAADRKAKQSSSKKKR
jgi:hypothetical protein